MKTQKIQLQWKFLIVIFVAINFSSCMSTQVVANHHSDGLDNEECQTVAHWKYWWGIGGSDEILLQPGSPDTVCPCESEAMASVVVKSSFGDFLLSFITLGIVNHRTISYQCAEVDEGEH